MTGGDPRNPIDFGPENQGERSDRVNVPLSPPHNAAFRRDSTPKPFVLFVTGSKRPTRTYLHTLPMPPYHSFSFSFSSINPFVIGPCILVFRCAMYNHHPLNKIFILEYESFTFVPAIHAIIPDVVSEVDPKYIRLNLKSRLYGKIHPRSSQWAIWGSVHSTTILRPQTIPPLSTGVYPPAKPTDTFAVWVMS